MAIEKQMGDAAAGIAVANSTKGLLPSSLTVTYLTRRGGGAAPRHTSLLRRSSLLVVLQHKKEEAFIGWMSSAALMAVEQKRPEMGGVRYSRYSSQEPPCLDQLQNGSEQQQQKHSSLSHKGQKRLFFCSAGRSSQQYSPTAHSSREWLLLLVPPPRVVVVVLYRNRGRDTKQRSSCLCADSYGGRRHCTAAMRKEALALSCGPVKKAASKAETGWPKIPPLSWPTLHAFLLRAQYIHICRGADGLRGCYS